MRSSRTPLIRVTARTRDGYEEFEVATGEFTFVALDQNDKPRQIPSPLEGEGGNRKAAEG